MLKKWKQTSGIIKRRIGLVLLAALIGFLGGLTNYFLWYHVPILPVGNIGVSVFAALVAYAILRYRLLDIQVAIRRGVLLALVYIFVLGIPFFVVRWMHHELGADSRMFWWIPLGMMAVLASGGPFIYLGLQKRAEKKTIQERYKRLEQLKVASGYMVRMTELEPLLQAIVHRVVKILKLTHAAIYLYDARKKQFQLRSAWGTSLEFSKSLPEWVGDDSLVVQLLRGEKFSRRREPLERDAIIHRLTQWGLGEGAVPLLERDLQVFGANVVIPAYDVGLELFGFLALGRVRDGRSLEPEELQELVLLANQAVSAIKNTEAIKQLEEYHKHMGHAEKLASMGRMMSSLIHDINNPLTVVCGNAQMLKMRWNGKLAEDDIKKITQIDECGRRAAGILQRLLKFSKPAGEEMTPIKVDEVVKKTVELAHSQLSFENLKLELELKAGCEILGNEMQLEEVVWNLFNNAWQAMHGSGKIRVTSERTDGHVLLIVEDTGPGMAPDVVERIFEPFYTTKKEGTGLGLYITHLIVLAHRGDIRCESEVGKGTKFIIEVPAYEGKMTRGIWRKPR